MASEYSVYSQSTPYSSAPSRPHQHFDPHTLLIILTVLVLPGLGWTYFNTLKTVTILLDQQSLTVLSNQITIAGVLNDHAISIASEDLVSPSLDSTVSPNTTISIHRAQPIQIEADGEIWRRRTQSQTIADALQESGVLLKPYDRVWIGQVAANPREPIQRALVPPRAEMPILKITVQRAIALQVDDNGTRLTIHTTASTIGEALREAGLTIFLGDSVTPDLGTPTAPGWQVFIRRSRAVTISIDGRTYQTRTRGEKISDVLKDEEIVLAEKDLTDPKPDEAVREGMSVTVIRVREDIVTESESISYETVWQADPAMEVDERQVAQSGVEGVKKRNILMRFENGREVRRTIEKEWIDSAPVTQIINYGTKIVKRELTLPNGQTIAYWRKVRMLATSYTAATSGKTRSNPYYGITATGMQAGVGIVAVDPRVVNLRSRLYVPGYGIAIAGDTGGGIKGRRIDLGFDEWNLVLWLKWVDVYLLDPPPSVDQIHFVIPDTPRERATSAR